MWLIFCEEWIWDVVGRKVEGTGGVEGAGTGIVKLDKIGFSLTKLN